MIDIRKYNVIDLSEEIHPNMYKVDGRFVRGKLSAIQGLRLFEAHQFISESPSFMVNVEAESHIGTHVEVPSHAYRNGKEGGKSAGEIPLEDWFGEAIVIDLTNAKQPITPDVLKKVKERDIVLFRHPFKSRETRPYLTIEGAKYLVEKRVKQVGWETGEMALGSKPHEGHEIHDILLTSGVSIIEDLVNLDKIVKDRVFYIGLGLKWVGLDAIWVRAMVLEEKD